ncbi:kinase-like protein [Artomyces pyxidatus]|uniref:Kinase-like protein n=1 Tax=Artomyces pyxidatus TaxID=48021 RepID=A0ACB8T7U6_9AGAM|nr:kinase-like protein [Artomyces pyxidatus]
MFFQQTCQKLFPTLIKFKSVEDTHALSIVAKSTSPASDEQMEERKLFEALWDAAHDPSLLDIRRRVKVSFRASQVHDVVFTNPDHLVQFSKLVGPAVGQPALLPAPESVASVGVRDFRVIKKLGSGASGVVYLAQHQTTLRLHAVKKMEKEYLDDGSINALLNEQRALLRVRGRAHLLTLDASFHDSDNFYLVTNFLAGGDLRTQLNEHGKLPIPSVLFYIAELLLALKTLHGAGVIHRDIKPDNLMIDALGHLVLGDFGISKQFESFSSDISIPYSTLSSTFLTATQCGTPTYIAPEIFQGSSYSFEVDFWAVGVTAFELLCGRTPFKDTDDFDEICHSVQYDAVCFDPTDEIDVALQVFIHHLLQKDPQHRPNLQAMMGHACFRSIDWAKLASKELPAPWVPSQLALHEEVQAIKARDDCFTFVSGDAFDVDPFPSYNFAAPRIFTERSFYKSSLVPWVQDFSPLSDTPRSVSKSSLASSAEVLQAPLLEVDDLVDPVFNTPNTPALSSSPSSNESIASTSSTKLAGFLGKVRNFLARTSHEAEPSPASPISQSSSFSSAPASVSTSSECSDRAFVVDSPVLEVDAPIFSVVSPTRPGSHVFSGLRSDCRRWMKNLNTRKARR